MDAPNQATFYTYDLLNNLTQVQQPGDNNEECGPSTTTCSQTRTFSYDSLSRLKQATNPESGTILYTYDANNNLQTKTDARLRVTTYAYDALNRVKTRTYTNEPSGFETPNVSYYYDLVANAKGKLIKVTNGSGDDRSTTEYVSFDILGRVTRSKQTTDNVVYGDDANPMTYTFNLSGALIEQRYPSGRVVKNVLDTDGDLATVQSKKNANNAFWNYANRFTYNAAGALTSMQLGNGRWESTRFNERLQPMQIALGKTAPVVDGQQVTYSAELLKLEYQYGDLDWDGSVIAGSNNGNVAKQTVTVAGVGATPGFTAVQNYDYDSLNRIQIANETLTPTSGTAETWTQDFRYDRYGNRTFNEPTTTTLPKECNGNTEVCAAIRPVVNPSANPADNKLNGYTFDSAGNTTRDAENRKFTYDAENKQTKVETLSGQTVTGTVGEYWYDGDGRRVKKRAYVNNVPTEETIFVYDASGKLIGEYSNEVASAQDAKVAYLTNDHLGSPRINTDLNGNITARHDYHPFGEKIASSKRATGIGYADDAVRKGFTGYERDNEINLDFAQARYYNSEHGRFTAVDPIFTSKEHPQNPQRWNLYVYVTNNPLNLTDPDGKKPKRVIDVFLTYDTTKEGRQEWTRIQKEAAKQGVKINIYRTDNGTASADGFIRSIQTKGRTTVLVGHSYSDAQNAPKRQGIGLWFDRPNNKYQAITNTEKMSENNLRPGTHTVDGVNARASTIAVFTCNFGGAFDRIGSSNSTNFLRANNGWNGESGLDSLNQAGLRLTQSIAAGGTARQAQEAATAGFNAFRNQTYDSDDSIGLRVLSPVTGH